MKLFFGKHRFLDKMIDTHLQTWLLIQEEEVPFRSQMQVVEFLGDNTFGLAAPWGGPCHDPLSTGGQQRGADS